MVFPYPVTVKRTGRRKTVALQIVDGAVHIRVPHRLSEKRIASILAQKDGWIRKKLALDAVKPRMQPRQFRSGDVFPYLGRAYRLELISGEQFEVKLRRGRLELSTPANLREDHLKPFVRNHLAAWYGARANRWLNLKTQQYSGRMGLSPARVEVKHFKSRWGSCSVDGTIKYNWRIIMAPVRIVDYLVVHELAHLVHHNHSPSYWKLLESHLPTYREERNWLKANGGLLVLDQTLTENTKIW